MATYQLEAGPVPLHHQVYLDLRSSLDAGHWRPGERLPTERELAVRYRCSLITVRRAMSELARESRIERSQGRGTFVSRPALRLDLGGTLSFAEEIRAQGSIPETRLVAARQEVAGPVVAAALEIRPDDQVLRLERLRLADGEPVLLEVAWLPAARFPGLLQEDLETNSLYDLMVSRYGTRIARARETFVPIGLPAREARLLGQAPHRPALLVEGIACTMDGRPVEYARSWVRGDRARYYVDREVERARWGGTTATGDRPGVTEFETR